MEKDSESGSNDPGESLGAELTGALRQPEALPLSQIFQFNRLRCKVRPDQTDIFRNKPG